MKQQKSGFPKILHWNASNLIPKMIQSKRARQNYEPEPTPTSSRTSFSNRNWRVREPKVNAILHYSNTWLTSFMPELDSFCRVFWRPNPRTIIQMKGESEVSIQEKSLSCKKGETFLGWCRHTLRIKSPFCARMCTCNKASRLRLRRPQRHIRLFAL